MEQIIARIFRGMEDLIGQMTVAIIHKQNVRGEIVSCMIISNLKIINCTYISIYILGLPSETRKIKINQTNDNNWVANGFSFFAQLKLGSLNN